MRSADFVITSVFGKSLYVHVKPQRSQVIGLVSGNSIKLPQAGQKLVVVEAFSSNVLNNSLPPISAMALIFYLEGRQWCGRGGTLGRRNTFRYV